MELLEYMNLIKKRWWLVLLIIIVSVLASAALDMYIISPVYEARATLLIGRTPRNQDEEVQYDAILAYQKLIKTYSELAKSRMIAEETIKTLGVDMAPEALLKNIMVSPKGDTQILEISVQDNDEERVIKIANTLANVFVDRVRTMMNTDDIKFIDEARPPADLISPNRTMDMAIGVLAGLIVAFSIAFLLERSDTILRSEEEVEKCLGIPVLESIPYMDKVH
jgi:capsular polysaccharide biosynthesis protein